MRTLIPWLLAIGFCFGATFYYTSDSRKTAELTTLRQSARDAQTLQSQLEGSRATIAMLEGEVNRLKKESDDLHHLHGDVTQLNGDVSQLRADKQQLGNQLTTAQNASTAALQQVQQLWTANQQLQGTLKHNEEQTQRSTCINQLRTLDIAKQEWALEHKKSPKDIPTGAELAMYLKNGIVPTCPAGGTYTIGAVEAIPVCSIGDHALHTEPAKP